MNAVEIEEAVSELARQPFDAAEFPFAFLRAFGRKEVELKRLRANNASDVEGGVLRRDSVHMAVSAQGGAEAAFEALRASPKTVANRVKFVLATDGLEVLAEETVTGDFRSFPLPDLDRHFGFFLPLAGISAVRQIKDNPIDVKAVGRLNKLYLELLHENPDWDKEAKRPELNRLMARLVFCFFAEDTGIFTGDNLFTSTLDLRTKGAEESAAGVLTQMFLAMATATQHDGRPDARYRNAAGVLPFADQFPYVNGGLFEDAGEVPRFSRAARNYLLHAGKLDWKEINPDIFGSMIQAVAEDDERASLGMHYTSVPNILKVLNPLFLDELNEKLTEAADSVRKLKALRRRLSRIRVFDPACGSGNFLVIAYRQMREIEHGIVMRTGDDPTSVIPLTNFYGIEIKGFAAEIARLALLIAEFQADSRLISQQAARSMVLPLHKSGKIVEGNALRLDWLEVCPPAAPVVEEWDLGGPTGRLALDENGLDGGGETEIYICGNPPYKGSKWQDEDQKSDLARAWSERPHLAKVLDYVTGWLACACSYLNSNRGAQAAFVATKSITQGQQAGDLWRALFDSGIVISFAHQAFNWENLAAKNAGVTVVVVGIARGPVSNCRLYEGSQVRKVGSIGCFLVANQTTTVFSRARPISGLPDMVFGNMPRDGGNLILERDEAQLLPSEAQPFVRPYVGSQELIDRLPRYCLWIADNHVKEASAISELAGRLARVTAERARSKAESTRKFAGQPHRFVQRIGIAKTSTIAVPGVSSENRPYLPCDLLGNGTVISNKNFGLFDSPMWTLALVTSRLHWIWIGTVCVRMRTDFSYSNTLGWNTFPVPALTAQDKADLTRCAEDILLAREAHFPATIADMYDPERMNRDFPDLRRAHDRNDEKLERIYIGRRFRNDTERLEHLFALYTKMTASDAAAGKKGPSKAPRKSRSAEKAV